MPYKSGTARWKNFVLLTWESVQGNLNAPLTSSMHKALAVELMFVSGLWDLNEQEVEELLCLLGILEVKMNR